MSKYDFVLFAAQSEDFIARLRELGLVDITTTGWEPTEENRQTMLDIEGIAKAREAIAAWRTTHTETGVAYATGAEAYAAYREAQQTAATHNAEIGRLEKQAEELRP
ncbi:MAG: V-type ATP synthase subunit I, partial [Alistipes sp.]|nr:V-type ATP synthase subunit I [Alistipes sp.]